MENNNIIPNLVNPSTVNKFPANYVCWEVIENTEDEYHKVNSTFFQATEYPLLRFFKNITKSLSLNEMDKKI